jgi:hypothetical protein
VRKALLVCVLMVALGGCSKPAASPPSPAGSSPAPAPTPTAFAGDLRTLLLPIPPAATRTPSPYGTDGNLTINDEAKLFDDPTQGLTQLRSSGYQRGAEVEWVESDGTWVGVILAQLDTADHTAQYAGTQQQGFANNTLFGPAVAISGVPQGFIYQRTSISSNNRWFSEAVFAKNTISVELFVTGPQHLGPEKLTALAKAEYALLP